MDENSGIGVDEFKLRYNPDPDETDYCWEVWKDGEFAVGGETDVGAIEALASVADAGNWYTDEDGDPWPQVVEQGESGEREETLYGETPNADQREGRDR
jgi:hypothetical protein